MQQTISIADRRGYGRPGLRKLMACALGVAVFFVVILSAFVAVFGSIDDVWMVLIASGAYTGVPSEYIIDIMNVYLGKAIKSLYLLFPSIQWYSVTLYCLHYAAMVTVLYLFVRRRCTAITVALYAVYILWFELDLLLQPSFTSTALVVAQAGIMAMIASDKNEQWWRLPVVAGMLMGLAGLTRQHASVWTIVASLPAVLVLVLVGAWRQSLAAVGCALVIFATGQTAHLYHYYRHPPWERYRQWVRMVVERIDYGGFSQTPEAMACYAAEGWTPNDLNAFSMCWLEDEKVWSNEKLQRVRMRVPPARGSWPQVRRGWNYLLRADMFRRMLVVTGVIVLWSLLSVGGSGRWLALATCAGGTACLAAIAYVGRMPDHVLMPSFGFINGGLLLLCAGYDGGRQRAPRWGRSLTIVLACCLCAARLIAHPLHGDVRAQRWLSTAWARASAWISHKRCLPFGQLVQQGRLARFMTSGWLTSEGIFNELAPNEKKLLVLVGGYSQLLRIRPFDRPGWTNICKFIITAWPSQSPHNRSVMQNFGVSNIVGFCDQPNVFIVCHPDLVRVIEQYYKQHYDLTVRMEPTNNAYRIVLVPQSSNLLLTAGSTGEQVITNNSTAYAAEQQPSTSSAMKRMLYIATGAVVLAACDKPPAPVPPAATAATEQVTSRSETNQDYLAVCDWLQAWQRAPQMSRIAEFMAVLDQLRAERKRWEAFAAALTNALVPAELLLLAKLCDEPHGSHDQRDMLIALRDVTTQATWPIYVYALERIVSSNDYLTMLMPFERLRATGFEPPERLDIGTAVWLGEFYRKYGGWQMYRDFWEYVRAGSPGLAWSAAIAVVRAEVLYLGITSNAVPLLRQYLGEITNYPAQAAECRQLVRGIDTPEAQELYHALQAAERK